MPAIINVYTNRMDLESECSHEEEYMDDIESGCCHEEDSDSDGYVATFKQ